MRAWSSARKAPAGCLRAWHRFGRLQQAGCYSPLVRKFSQSIWGWRRSSTQIWLSGPWWTSQTTGRRGGPGGLFCLGARQADGGFRAALLLLL